MPFTNTNQSENHLHTAISLLDAADYCDNATLAVEEVTSLIKDNFPQSAATRSITSILRTLTTALPLISHSVKSRSSKCAPTNSNALYAWQRLHTISDTPPASGVTKLQQLIDDSSTKPKPTTSKRVSTQKRKSNEVSPSEKNDVPIKMCPLHPTTTSF
jgi:hypothetical protein